MFHEFTSFLAQYNVVGMAIGLLVASKVGALVKGLVEDLITPILLNPMFTKLKVKNLELLSFKGILYGKTLATLIDFLITAFLVFMLIKYMNISIK